MGDMADMHMDMFFSGDYEELSDPFCNPFALSPRGAKFRRGKGAYSPWPSRARCIRCDEPNLAWKKVEVNGERVWRLTRGSEIHTCSGHGDRYLVNLACPSCEGIDLAVIAEGGFAGSFYHIECQQCGTRGPGSWDLDIAAGGWDRIPRRGWPRLTDNRCWYGKMRRIYGE